jgi:integrase
MEQLGRAASTRRSAYAALRSAFDDAVIDGLLAASRVLRVKRPRATHGEATSLEPEQVAQLLQGAEDLRYATVLRLILGTGLRRGEALALRWADVRLDRCELSIKGLADPAGWWAGWSRTPRPSGRAGWFAEPNHGPADHRATGLAGG